MYPDKEADLLKAFSPAEPIFTVDPDYIKRARSLSKREDDPCGQALKSLLVKADAALKQEPLTIVNKPILPASGDKHDYMSVGPYWWPDPDKPDGLPYIRRDGEVNPEVEKTDRPLLAKFISTVKTLGFCVWFYTSRRLRGACCIVVANMVFESRNQDEPKPVVWTGHTWDMRRARYRAY